jgi:hypothetical protein
MKKRGKLKMQRGLSRRHPMKKEATPKNAKGLIKKRHPRKKEATQKFPTNIHINQSQLR